MSENKPTILITNDDGFEAKGLWAMVEAASEFGNLTIITPDGPRSAMSHAITMNYPLRVKEYIGHNGIKYYRSNGTPADCVKVGQRVLLKDKKIDLVLSGINHGINASAAIHYSGTMAAAIEAAFEQIPAVGISLLDYSHDADFTASIEISKQLLSKLFTHSLPKEMCLNVNIPNVSIPEIKGMKITHQAKGYWFEDLQERLDVISQPYYWLTGELRLQEDSEDACLVALKNHYVSIQPVQLDLTAYHHIQPLKFLEQ